jgi:hypothetical protein
MAHPPDTPPPVPARVSTRGRIFRVLAFAVLVVHLQAGSFAEQVLGVRRPRTTMSWRMYSGTGKGVCATEWFSAGADGVLAPLDRLATPSDRPHRRHLRSAREVEDTGRRLCRLLGGVVDVRVQARCGTRAGVWREVFTPDRRMCPAPRGTGP